MTDPRVGAQHIIDRAAAAEASNLDSLFLGDHHATPTPYYQNIPMMGRLLANWSGRQCGVLLLLPLWHPVLVAEMLSTLASLTSSTFVLQAGIGYGEKQFSALSADYEQRGERFEQSLNYPARALVRGNGQQPFMGDRAGHHQSNAFRAYCHLDWRHRAHCAKARCPNGSQLAG